jgi:hypothetical protein
VRRGKLELSMAARVSLLQFFSGAPALAESSDRKSQPQENKSWGGVLYW